MHKFGSGTTCQSRSVKPCLVLPAQFHSMNMTCDLQIIPPKCSLTESEPKLTGNSLSEINRLSRLFIRSSVHLHPPLPPHSAFCCHDSGATVLAMAPRNQLLITGGRKGWISILELPHKLQRQSFQAHDSPVKALAVDPTEDCFISGSSEGNIRVIMSHSSVRPSVVFTACL